jgi:phenylpropionate dioxygenase-like ring-hydroxylating dioxygenase large terminal subunit
MASFPAELEGQWTYIHFWPAQFIDIYPDTMDVWQMQPEAPLRTRTMSINFRSPDESLRDMLVRQINHRFNSEVMDEDVELCDGVQVGLGSMTYTRGVLNDNEAAVGHFHDLLRDAVPGIDDLS